MTQAPPLPQRRLVAKDPIRKLVAPETGKDANPKTGCFWCPLMPFHADFNMHRSRYCRDADKILSKEREGHVVKNRNVSEPWTEVDILFVGEAPGGQEDNEGVPFVGRSGKLLREAIKEYIPHVKPERIGIANTVRCRPPRNKDPQKGAIQCCTPELIREIAARKPKLVVVLGNISLEFLTGETGISTKCGKFLKCIRPEFPNLKILGCLHPAYILRMDHEIQKFVDAIDLAGKYIAGKVEELPGIGQYKVIETAAEAAAMFAKFKADGKKVTFDTETGALSAFATQFPSLLCFSFSNEEGRGYTLPWDHKDSPFQNFYELKGPRVGERQKILHTLRQFFTDATIRKVAQNEKFDRQHIRHEIGVQPRGVESDTMISHLVIDEKRGTHGLDILAYTFTGMGGYDIPLRNYIEKHKKTCDPDPEVGGSYANIPGDLLFAYAAADADCTLRVINRIETLPEFKDNPKFVALAKTYLMDLSIVLADMEYQGAQVDPEVVAKLDKKYTAEMEQHAATIRTLPTVKRFEADQIKAGKTGKRKNEVFQFNPGSPKQLAKILFDYYKLVPIETTDDGFLRLVGRYNKAVEEAKAHNDRIPKYRDTVVAAIRNKEWDLFTTNADSLNDFANKGNELAQPILAYREAQTLYGTFVKPLKDMLDANGRVHGTYMIHGTVTGRLASRDPNLQNIPNKGGALIKQAYVSRFGADGLILNVDFSQIELRVAAGWFNDPVMIEAYNNGEDLHRLTAIIIAGCRDEEEFSQLPKDKQKEWRTRAKRVNFGVLYGGGAPALLSTLRKDGVFNLTLEDCQNFIDRFFEKRPHLKRALEALERTVCETGYLESFTGRRRRVPEVFSEDNELRARAVRQSINFPIQSGAGDMTLMAAVLIHRVLEKEKFKSKMILTVHDSLIFDCHVSEYLEVAKLVKEIMENIPTLSEEVLPGLDWSWLTVPIVAECECGSNWGMLVEFDPATIEANEKATGGWIIKNEKGKEDIGRKPVNQGELWEQISWKIKNKAVA